MSKQLKSNFILLFAAIIWGFAFVAQKAGMEFVGPFTYNGVRFILGGLSLIPVAFIFERECEKSRFKYTVFAAVITGVALFTAVNLQQVGLLYMDGVGKAGFLTGIYTVLVPIAGVIFFKMKSHLNIWLGAVLALVGLFFVSFFDTFSFSFADILVILSSLMFSVQILMVDRFSKKMYPIKFSSIQFLTCGVLSLITALIFETISITTILSASLPILYGGLCSVGIAYTLQIIGQKNANPTAAAIIMSTESVFALLGGVLLRGESLSPLAAVGCVLIFAGIVLAQLPNKQK
jgi:drug/metabolite transporter (DMT)-like permease